MGPREEQVHRQEMGGYLREILADGATPFLFRESVSSLLGGMGKSRHPCQTAPYPPRKEFPRKVCAPGKETAPSPGGGRSGEETCLVLGKMRLHRTSDSLPSRKGEEQGMGASERTDTPDEGCAARFGEKECRRDGALRTDRDIYRDAKLPVRCGEMMTVRDLSTPRNDIRSAILSMDGRSPHGAGGAGEIGDHEGKDGTGDVKSAGAAATANTVRRAGELHVSSLVPGVKVKASPATPGRNAGVSAVTGKRISASPQSVLRRDIDRPNAAARAGKTDYGKRMEAETVDGQGGPYGGEGEERLEDADRSGNSEAAASRARPCTHDRLAGGAGRPGPLVIPGVTEEKVMFRLGADTAAWEHGASGFQDDGDRGNGETNGLDLPPREGSGTGPAAEPPTGFVSPLRMQEEKGLPAPVDGDAAIASPRGEPGEDGFSGDPQLTVSIPRGNRHDGGPGKNSMGWLEGFRDLTGLPGSARIFTEEDALLLENTRQARNDREMAGVFRTLEEKLRLRMDRLREAAQKRQEETPAISVEMKHDDGAGQAQGMRPADKGRRNMARHMASRPVSPAAFWERSYLGRLYLRPLR